MALEIQKGRSKWWYGRVTFNGRSVVKNLGVEIRGMIPASLTERGDTAFERSRAKAQAVLEVLQDDFKKRRNAEELVQTIHEIRTGARVGSIQLSEAGARWGALPRRRPLSERYAAQTESWIGRFVDFLIQNYPAADEMAKVHSVMACAFLKQEENRKVSAKTYNGTLIFLRSLFEALKEDAGISRNPFADIPLKEEDPIYRKPFDAEELAAIVEAAKSEPFVHPIIIAAICTAMRRRDCCMLLRSEVDLPGRFIRTRTSKTGEFVHIPIFPLLYDTLAKLEPNDSVFVFPEQAAEYLKNPDYITDRVRRVFRAAGFFDPCDPKSSDVEGMPRGETHQARKNGLRKASIRDFHSFRVTWVTLALNAGVPLELVKKVTGHRTAEIVIKHYFRPAREDLRRILADKLPPLLGILHDAEPPDADELLSELGAMTSTTWMEVRDRLLVRLGHGKTKEDAIRPSGPPTNLAIGAPISRSDLSS